MDNSLRDNHWSRAMTKANCTHLLVFFNNVKVTTWTRKETHFFEALLYETHCIKYKKHVQHLPLNIYLICQKLRRFYQYFIIFLFNLTKKLQNKISNILTSIFRINFWKSLTTNCRNIVSLSLASTFNFHLGRKHLQKNILKEIPNSNLNCHN